ncbi:hypothetical protein [Sulfodiicoccus acidiphilus]|uniref:hypothetical protein n=1 Tax=Sulfodiicoccus acidiphilus TaxID=1670455 RepID=UPI000F83523D|nr:hypothetical protein [Sulfodiicoccus acidiphilus]
MRGLDHLPDEGSPTNFDGKCRTPESTRLAESVAPGRNPGKRAVGEVRQVEGANPRWRTRAASPRPGGTSSPGGAPAVDDEVLCVQWTEGTSPPEGSGGGLLSV